MIKTRSPIEHSVCLDPCNPEVLTAALTYELILRGVVVEFTGLPVGVRVRVRPSQRMQTAHPRPAHALCLILDIGPESGSLSWYLLTPDSDSPQYLGPGTSASVIANRLADELHFI